MRQTWYTTRDLEATPTHYVAVYGTLKLGHGNYERCIQDTNHQFLGSGVTEDGNFVMSNVGIPYVYHDTGIAAPSGKLRPHFDTKVHGRITLEIFVVNDDTRVILDHLEGHPNHYRRRQVPIRLLKDFSGEELSVQVIGPAWLYVVDNENYLNTTDIVEPDKKGHITYNQRTANEYLERQRKVNLDYR